MTQLFFNACQILRSQLEEQETAIKATYTKLPENEDSHAEFIYILADYFEDSFKGWGYRLANLKEAPMWHAIETPVVDDEILLDDYLQATPCVHSALAVVLDAMLDKRILPESGVVFPNGSIEIKSCQETIANIYPVTFAQVQTKDISRATTALKGLHLHDHDLIFAKKLKDIQGLDQMLCDISKNPRLDPQCKRPLHESCKNLASLMVECVDQLTGKQIKRAVAQELVANFFTYESWNHFVAAEKQFGDMVAMPYYLANTNDDGMQGKVAGFYKGLPAALWGFGQLLGRQERKTFHVSRLMGFSASNYTPNTIEEFGKTNELYAEKEGLQLSRLDDVSLEPGYAALLKSDDFNNSLLSYFGVEYPLFERIIRYNKNKGIPESEQLRLGSWVFWWEPRDYNEGVLFGERFDPISGTREQEVASDLHKASIVLNEDNQYCLATNWDRKPKHVLTDLSKEQLIKLQERFSISAMSSGRWFNNNTF